MKPRPLDHQGSSKGHYLCYTLLYGQVHKACEAHYSVFSQISLPLHSQVFSALWKVPADTSFHVLPLALLPRTEDEYSSNETLNGKLSPFWPKNFMHKHTNEHIHTYTCIPTQIAFIYIGTGTFPCNICMHIFILYKYAYPRLVYKPKHLPLAARLVKFLAKYQIRTQ